MGKTRQNAGHLRDLRAWARLVPHGWRIASCAARREWDSTPAKLGRTAGQGSLSGEWRARGPHRLDPAIGSLGRQAMVVYHIELHPGQPHCTRDLLSPRCSDKILSVSELLPEERQIAVAMGRARKGQNAAAEGNSEECGNPVRRRGSARPGAADQVLRLS